MAHSEICPVCGGSGEAKTGATCKGCEGKGWVTVQDYDQVCSAPGITLDSPLVDAVITPRGEDDIEGNSDED